MVGSDDQVVVFPHFRKELAEPSVERRHRGGVSPHIVSMTVGHIEIDEIHEAKPAKIPICDSNGLIHAVVVIYGAIALGHTSSGKNIVYLPDRNARKSGFLHKIRHSLFGRLKRKIMSARRSLIGPITREGSRYDSSDAVFADKELTRKLAVTVELIDRHKVLVRGYLKNAVSRGLDYQLTGSKVLASVIAYNVSPRIRQIA